MHCMLPIMKQLRKYNKALLLYLSLGLFEGCCFMKILPSYSTPPSAKICDWINRLDEFVINYIPIIGDYAAAGQFTAMTFETCPYHLTVKGDIFQRVEQH